MSKFNTLEWNQGEWNQGPDSPLLLPAAPVATISKPLVPPPQQFTNYATLINGQYKEAGIMLFQNGILQTQGFDYSRVGGVVTFVSPPIEGATLTARVFVIGKQLGGATQERYVAPWTLSLDGPRDGLTAEYHIVFGPTITGACDGVNRLFQWGCVFPRVQVWRNGVLQTINADYAAGQTALVFLPAAFPPLPGDILTLEGYSE